MFSQVIISSHPQGWGNAHKTLYPDLRVFGGHLSGVPEAPLVHQSEAILDDEAGHEAFALIQDILLIQNDEQRSQVLPEQKLNGYKLLDIYITEEQY
ncbi:MAG: hypothetical protein KKC64_14490 [Spirochaetes bacterium]|nr:hypothetical protein [Spirochaetota bacterium]